MSAIKMSKSKPVYAIIKNNNLWNFVRNRCRQPIFLDFQDLTSRTSLGSITTHPWMMANNITRAVLRLH